MKIVTRLGLRLAVAVVAAIGLVGVSSVTSVTGPAPAQASTRPAFQLPHTCGTTWTTSTHGGHASMYMVDLVSSGGVTRGAPVLASAAGTVTQSFYSASGGHMVVVDHGGGWITRYLHMDRRDVSAGQWVAQGRQLGVVGSTGHSSGPHLHYEQRLNNVVQPAVFNGRTLPVRWSYHQHYETSANCGGGGAPALSWVDTWAPAPGYSSPGGTHTGSLYRGTHYVFCKVWGPRVGTSTQWNHWWMKTDLDVGPRNQWVSAYYLSRWGNDEARDNSGRVIPNC